uniref:Uncharacterized protein n=1 Tax=Panagrolaimus sp. ES5 TaxID=591445 RepID=A0AC34GF55_9BILA
MLTTIRHRVVALRQQFDTMLPFVAGCTYEELRDAIPEIKSFVMAVVNFEEDCDGRIRLGRQGHEHPANMNINPFGDNDENDPPEQQQQTQQEDQQFFGGNNGGGGPEFGGGGGPGHDDEEVMPAAKEDTWAFQPIGAPFPDA